MPAAAERWYTLKPPPPCDLHICDMDIKFSIYSVSDAEWLVLAFVMYFTRYFHLHEDWRRMRVMFLMERALSKPAGGFTRDAEPFRDVAAQCVRLWRSAKGSSLQRTMAIALPDDRELLEYVASVAGMPPPTQAQFDALLDDLHRLGARYLM